MSFVKEASSYELRPSNKRMKEKSKKMVQGALRNSAIVMRRATTTDQRKRIDYYAKCPTNVCNVCGDVAESANASKSHKRGIHFDHRVNCTVHSCGCTVHSCGCIYRCEKKRNQHCIKCGKKH